MTDPELLSRPSFEILPTEGAEERTGHLPSDAKITMTCSQGQGIEHTLHFSERLLPRGSWPTGHTSKRYCGGSTSIYAIGGDAKEPVGSYASALQMFGPQKASGSGVAR